MRNNVANLERISTKQFRRGGLELEEVLFRVDADKLKLCWARVPFDQCYFDGVPSPILHTNYRDEPNAYESAVHRLRDTFDKRGMRI